VAVFSLSATAAMYFHNIVVINKPLTRKATVDSFCLPLTF